MAESSKGPTIILIGGRVTLDSGAELDTRRPIAGDDWDFTLRAALGGSEAFWQRAKDLTDTILDEHPDEDSWAFAWVNKTIKRPKADGSFTRVRTIKFLDDAVRLTDVLRPNKTEDPSSEVLTTYRIMPYYLRFDEVTDPGPAVFIGAFHTTHEDGTDLIGLRPLADVLHRWPETVLVLPHTPLIEKKAQGILDWHRKGRPPPKRDRYGSVGLAENTHPKEARRFIEAYEASEDLRGADPYIIEHDLQFTFWADNGTVQGASDLEAAFTFVKSRYDLRFGLWDLARDPILRESLLEPEEQKAPSPEPMSVPEELAESAKERGREREQARLAERSARDALHEKIWPSLKDRGWRFFPGKEGTEYRLAAGPQVESPYEGVGSEPSVFFVLMVHKKQATLNLFAATRIEATEKLLGQQANAIARITGEPPEPETNTVWRLSERGWDGSLDGWAKDIDVIHSCIEALTPHLEPVVDAAVEFRVEQLESMQPLEVTVEVSLESEQPEQKSGLWTRLFGKK